jgi:hypothetical protein
MFHSPISIPKKLPPSDNPKKLNKNEVAKKIKFNLENIEKEENNAKAIFTRVEP